MIIDGENYMNIARILYWWFMEMLSEVSQKSNMNRMNMRDCLVMAAFRLTEFKNLSSFEKLTESGHIIEIIQQSIKYLYK